MFMAFFEIKCSILPFICGGQFSSFGQNQATSPSFCCSGVLHSGQFEINSTFFALFLSSVSTFVIFGIISRLFLRGQNQCNVSLVAK